MSDRLHDHLQEIRAVRVGTAAQPDGLDFAKRRGYDGTRQMHFSAVDPRVLPEQPPTPDGIELKRIDELQPEQVNAADAVASLDEPGDSPLDAVGYENWLDEIWNAPGRNPELGVAAMAGDGGLARAAGAGASEPYPFIVSSGGQAEIILGPYEVVHIVAVSR